MVADGEMLEWAEVFHGHRYGTPSGPVGLHRDAGNDVVLEIDVEGARWVRERVPDAIMILLEPPSRDELERRLRSRGTESDASIAERLAKADWELSQRSLFDHVVVNDELDRASTQVAAIIEASRVRPASDAGEALARPHGGSFRMIEPKIDDLLAAVDSKYTLVILAAKRAREINSYYNQLGEGRGEFVPPLVESGFSNKPLSIALEEIAEGKIEYVRTEEPAEAE